MPILGPSRNGTMSEHRNSLLRASPAASISIRRPLRNQKVEGRFRFRTSFFAKPDFGDPDGAHKNRARQRARFGGMPGGLGIAIAIEPAGGVSPLRGGAGVWEILSYRQKRSANYRS